MEGITALLSNFTLRNVLLGASLVGLGSGVLGSFALLRRQSLLGDALSHAALPGICLGFLVAGSRQMLPLLLGALVAGAAAAGVLLLLTRRSRIKEDAGLGIVLSVFFAVGTVLLTYIQNQNDAGQAGLESFLFGQAAAIVPQDLWVMAAISAFALGAILLFWKEAKVVTFDPGYARSLGLPVGVIDLGLTMLVALAVVTGLQLVGVVLMSAMLVAPAAAARQWTDRLGYMVVLAALFGAASGAVGALLSATGRGLATGPLIVLVASGIVLFSLFAAPNRGLLWAALRSRRERNLLRERHVLSDLYALAASHGDPHYKTERGMVDTLYGASAGASLKALAAQGLVTRAGHIQEEGEHWVLTERGYARAQALQDPEARRE